MRGVRDPLNFHRLQGGGGFKVTLSPLEDALAVYRQNRVGAVIAAVRKSYPATEQLLGEALFLAMVREFAAQWRPGPSLDWAGETLLPWLRSQQRAQGLWSDYPFLAALMRWEWGIHNAYYAYRQSPVTIESCVRWLERGGDPPWRLNPGVTLVASSYPIEAIWRTLSALARGEEGELQLQSGRQRLWIIWPTDQALAWEALTPPLRMALASVRHPRRRTVLSPKALATLLVRQWLVAP